MKYYTQQSSENLLFLHKSICIFFLLVSAGASLYLTTVFMTELGEGVGMAVLFATIGVMMDLFKSYAPTLILAMNHRSKPLSLLVFLVFIGLITVSVCASVFSLQNSVNSALSSTKLAQINQQKIEAIQIEIDGLRKLQATQIAVSHVSKASETATIINRKTMELTELLDKSNSPTQGGFLQNNSNMLILVVSALLEVISVVSSIALYLFSSQSKSSVFPVSQNKTIQNDTKQDKAKQDKARQDNLPQESSKNGAELLPSHAPQAEAPSNLTEQSVEDQKCTPHTLPHTFKTKEQVLFDMQGALLAGLCKPNQRDVYSNFKKHIRQKEVTVYLRALVEKNVLANGPNGTFVLAGLS